MGLKEPPGNFLCPGFLKQGGGLNVQDNDIQDNCIKIKSGPSHSLLSACTIQLSRSPDPGLLILPC